MIDKSFDQIGVIYAVIYNENKMEETGLFKISSFPKAKEIIDRIQFQNDYSVAKKELAIKHGENPDAWASNHPIFLQ